MKRLGELLLDTSGGSEIYMSNTAVVRAMIEEGIRVVSSYPGSPTPEIGSAILSIPRDKRPFYFEFSVNEKVALEVAVGASVNGYPSCVFFKSVGLNVASDSFMQLSMLELTGGMVIILGDDPGANSSQNEQDNRHYAYMSYTPVFEPANPQESYEMFKEALVLSKKHRIPVILRMTTHVCHAKGVVKYSPWNPVAIEKKPSFDPVSNPYIPLTTTVAGLKLKALKRLKTLEEYSNTSRFNKKTLTGKERGIITAGLPYLSLLDALSRVKEKPDLLSLGMVNPLPREEIAQFLASHREIKILEELDPVLEREIKTIAFERSLKTHIIGKADLEDWIGEYTPGRVKTILKKTWPDLGITTIQSPSEIPAPSRPAQLCPGCGHRSAFHAIKKALSREDITVADIGCHSLGFLPPYEMGQILLSMGHSTSTGSGLSLFNDTRKVVAFLGDSTFFHAGLPGIINAVYNQHNLTLIIMENGTTAMTGHQEHPGTGKSVNSPGEAISIKELLTALGIKNIRDLDTYQQAKLTAAVKEALSEPGFKVIIARHPCMLKFTRERKREGKFPSTQARIKQEVCERIHECVSSFGCPSFVLDEKGKVTVNEELCIGDGSCLQTCPVKAIELVKKETTNE